MQSMSIPAPPTLYIKNYNAADGPHHPLSVHAAATTATNTTLAHEPVYHWTLVLALTDPPRTVTLDPIPGVDLRTAVLLVSSAPASAPATGTDAPAFAVQPAPGRTIDDFVRFITDTGLDRFRFDASGSGCRHWCGTVLQKWERAGLVEPGSAEAFLRWVAELHAREPGRVPMPLREGTWY